MGDVAYVTEPRDSRFASAIVPALSYVSLPKSLAVQRVSSDGKSWVNLLDGGEVRLLESIRVEVSTGLQAKTAELKVTSESGQIITQTTRTLGLDDSERFWVFTAPATPGRYTITGEECKRLFGVPTGCDTFRLSFVVTQNAPPNPPGGPREEGTLDKIQGVLMWTAIGAVAIGATVLVVKVVPSITGRAKIPVG